MTLFFLLFGLSLVVDPLSSLGSDVGGKTATMSVLSTEGSLDLGYWAASLDPDGSLHPFFGTKVLDGQWVNATTFPMLYLAWPLHEIGGMPLAMILPVLGGVFTATAARRLASLLGPTDGAAAYWIVGLATPVAVYSLAFWEHAPGLALMAWGIVGVVSAVDTGRFWPALASGLLFGVAATMRQEALVYGAAAGIWLVLGLVRTVGLPVVIRSAVGMLSGCLAMLGANTLLEQWVLGSSFRATRTGGAARAAGSEVGTRVHDALLTVLVPSDVGIVGVSLGLMLVAGSVLLVRSRRSPRDRPVFVAMVVLPVAAVVLTALVDGRAFVPSLVFTTPLAGVGAAIGWHDRRTRAPLSFAVLTLPVVLAVQSTGGFEAQWGGRYLLLSGFTLTVIACARSNELTRGSFAIMVAVAVAVTSMGIGWTIERSVAMGNFYRAIEALDAPVVVFDSALTARGAGEIMLDQPMLAVENADDAVEAAAVLAAADVVSFVLVTPDVGSSTATFGGYAASETSTIDFVSGLAFRVTTFVPVP